MEGPNHWWIRSENTLCPVKLYSLGAKELVHHKYIIRKLQKYPAHIYLVYPKYTLSYVVSLKRIFLTQDC